MLEFGNSVLNARATPSITADTFANIPAPGIVGRLFVRDDAPYGIYRDDGTSWVLISGGGGSGPAAPPTSIQFNNAGAFGGNVNFTYGVTPYGNGVNLLNNALYMDSGPIFAQNVNNAGPGGFGQWLTGQYVFNGAQGFVDTYGVRAQLYLVMGGGTWTGNASFNATAIQGQVTVNGNNGVQPTQPISAISAVLTPYLNAGLLGEFRHVHVKQPDTAGATPGTVVDTMYGVYVDSLKDAPGFTINNAWGLWVAGTGDKNYVAGRIGFGSGPSARQVNIVGGIEFDTGQMSPTAGGSAGEHLIVYIGGTQYKIALLNP